MAQASQNKKAADLVAELYDENGKLKVQPGDGAPAVEPTIPAAELPPAEPTPPTNVAPIVPPQDELALVQQQYRSLQGMFNSLTRQSQEQGALIDQLRQALQAQAAAAPQAPAQAPASSVTAKELEEYTPEFFAMLDRWQAAKLAPLATQVQNLSQHVPAAIHGLQNQVTQVAQVQHKSRDEQFFDQLDVRVPDWMAINNSPQFQQWLEVLDPMTNISRHVYVNDARQKLDVDRVATVFNAYKKEVGLGAAAPAAKPNDLQQQAVVLPRTGAAPNINAADDTQVFTRADLDNLYKLQREGHYKGKEAEFRAAEQELFDAMASGRYRN